MKGLYTDVVLFTFDISEYLYFKWQEFELNNFQSLTIEELETQTESLNIEYIITDSVYTDSVPRGTIFTQDPLPGTFVSCRKIYVTVNCMNRQKIYSS